MRFCFIVESKYRNESMPIVVAHQLLDWGHDVDLLEPQTSIIYLSDVMRAGYDAYVLKTMSDGPGLSILEAAEAAGIPTINQARAIRQVRDKAVATTRALAYGLPVPRTYFVPHPGSLAQVPETDYPIVVKPTNGSSGRGIYKVNSPSDLSTLHIAEAGNSYFLAQHYVENSNFDIKLYVVGTHISAVAKRSPLHSDVEVEKHRIPVSLELRNLALYVGNVFGLDIYGLDVVENPNGPMVVDINDFPSFGYVPDAAALVAAHIIEVASHRVARHLSDVPTVRLTGIPDEIAKSA